jgi:hypothetical protein
MKIPIEILQEYRDRTFRYHPDMRLKSVEDAISFVNERKFTFFWPIQGMLLPSLWAAVAGNRPVADEHDDPGHVTWGWKDSMLGKKVWYYGKILRKRSTMISLDALPYFYALSENYGTPEEDYLTLYQQGRLTLESKLVFEALVKGGPIDTIALRKTTHLTSRESDSRFNRALTDLQANFQILPVQIVDAGRWHYAMAYDLTTRQFPDLIDRTRYITDREAYAHLAHGYILSVGACQARDITRLFGWEQPAATRAIENLIKEGKVCEVEIEGSAARMIAASELIR